MNRLASGLMVVIITQMIFISLSSCKAADLISGHDWQHFTGATINSTGIEIIPINRMIVPKISLPSETNEPGVAQLAKTPPTPNPPINLRGSILQVKGDFSISVVMDINFTKGSYVDLYGTLPIIYDEWRQEGKRLRLGVNKGALNVFLWNGESAEPEINIFGSGLTGSVTITMIRSKGQLLFEVNGQPLGQIKDSGVFNNGQIVFGAEAELGGGFTIRHLSAQAINEDSEVTVVDRQNLATYIVPIDSLRFVAASRKKPIYIGAAVASIPLVTDEKYQALVGQEFSMVTPENDMKFQFIHPQPNIYAFNEADSIVEFAQLNHIRVHGHTLVWHEALPRWVTTVERSPSETKQLLSDHIRTTVGHYKGRVAEWDVVNEPFKDMEFTINHGLRSANPWFKSMGESYIEFAFYEAHAADPDARLYLNEYGIEEPGEKFDALYAFVKKMLAHGVPIHGIGFQMHEDMEDGRYIGSQPELVAANMKKILDLGLEVRVSEMDVNLNGKATPQRLAEQARAFSEMMAMSLKQEGLQSFGQWGVTDRYSSLAPMNEYFKFGNGLLFDTDYHPKASYYKLKSKLMEI